MIQELTLPEIATSDRHSMKRGPFGGALKKDIFVDEGYVVYEQQHAIYKRFNDVRYYIDEIKYKELVAFKVEEGDLIISCSGTIGKIAEVPKGFKPGIINQALLKLTLDQSKVLNKYFIYLFEGEEIQNQLFYLSHGTGLKNFPPMSVVKSIKFPLPPLDQQKKIAAILDAADAYRQKTKALITKYDELKQSLFLNMFGDPVSNPKGWDKKTLVDIVSSEQYSLKRGPFGGSLKKEIFKETGYKVYEQKNAIKKNVKGGKYFIDEIKYNEMKAFNVNPGDFIVSCSGTIGEIFQIPVGAPEGIINQALMKIKINEELLLPNFFESLFTYYIKDNIFISGSKGSGLKNVSSMKIIKAERFIVPSIEYQKKYVDLKLNLKKQKAQAQASLAQAEDLFNSLLQRAFKGELTS